jgi:hypothetical protein
MLRLLTFLFLGLGVPIALAVDGVSSWAWIGLGAAAWAGAVVVKAAPFTGGLVGFTAEGLFKAEWPKAAVWGIWSALCELGAAVIVFLAAFDPTWYLPGVYDPRASHAYPSLGNAVGFGVGAGSVEVIALLVVASIGSGANPGAGRGRGACGRPGPPDPCATDSAQPAATPADEFMEWSGIIERFLACVGHLATRIMIWAAVKAWLLTPAVVFPYAAFAFPMATFALVDGVATYGQAVEWDWEDGGTARRFYGFVAAVTVLEAIACIASVLMVDRLMDAAW